MAWNGEVPLLGFEDEYYYADGAHSDRRILYIPVPKYGTVNVYAWSLQNMEGYNIFWPYKTPFNTSTGQANDPFTAKMIIQAYFNRLDHYHKTGEIDYAYELQSSGNGR